MLKHGKMSVPQPTSQEVHTRLTMGSLRIDAIDLGGHDSARRAWREHYVGASAVVFVVDAADPSRFNEAREELFSLLNNSLLSNIPFLILGNKIDLPNAVSEQQLKSELGLTMLCSGKDERRLSPDMRPLEVFMSSILARTGYSDGFKFLSRHL
ncbi:hypothetical protein RCL1_006781 [Eukaryota sp. TZLM3-RCL]